MLLLHLVSRAEETMTLFVSSFKHFHGPLPAGPHQWPAQAETGKVSIVRPLHSPDEPKDTKRTYRIL